VVFNHSACEGQGGKSHFFKEIIFPNETGVFDGHHQPCQFQQTLPIRAKPVHVRDCHIPGPTASWCCVLSLRYHYLGLPGSDLYHQKPAIFPPNGLDISMVRIHTGRHLVNQWHAS